MTQTADSVAGRLALLDLKAPEIARIADVAAPTAYRWLQGKRIPHEKSLRRIADATGVNLEWLATGAGEMGERRPAPPRNQERPAYRSMVPDIERAEAAIMAQREAEAVGVAPDTYERPYAVISGVRVPLPLRDVEVDEVTGRPLIGYVTIPVALGPPRLTAVPAGLSSSRSER